MLFGMPWNMADKTAILLSGGMDSIALAYWLRPTLAITVDYGQIAAEAEVRASRKICEELGIRHDVISINCRALGSGDMAGLSVPECAPSPEWWPFRNQLLVTFAAARLIGFGMDRLLVGSVKTDGDYADGRHEFYRAIDILVSGQEGGIHVEAPALDMTSDELIHKSGIGLGLLSWAHSCVLGNYACGRCRSCQKHRAVMKRLGYPEY